MLLEQLSRRNIVEINKKLLKLYPKWSPTPFRVGTDPGLMQWWTKGLRNFGSIFLLLFPLVLLCEIVHTWWQTTTNKQPLSIKWCNVIDHVTVSKTLNITQNKQLRSRNQHMVTNTCQSNCVTSKITYICFSISVLLNFYENIRC